MTLGGATTIMQTVLITLGFTGVLGLTLISVYRENRLLFWCVTGAFIAHILFAGSLWAVDVIFKEKPGERQIAVSIQAPEVEKKKPEPPKIEEPEHNLDLPLGRPDGKRDVTKIKKGTTLNPNAREGAKGAKIFGNQHTLASPTDGGAGDVAYDPDAKGYDLYGPGDSMNPRDLYAIGKPGGGGDDWGIPEGDPDGGVPAGFAQGKVGGRVYFVRLQYGNGAWIAYNDGTKRLLAYLNKSFPCQADTWPMSTAELRKKYLNKGVQPSFLYVYCDENFVLSNEDVLVLRDYMDKGGFLFLDSRPDPLIKDVVARQMDKVLPGLRLAPISQSHPINSFLYRLPAPGLGENIFDKKNYGVTRGGRLIVFYSMGNLSHIYAAFEPESIEYVTAQYQMGANVMLYGITKGNPAGFAQKQGAKSVVTTQALEQMGFLSPVSTDKPKEPGESVKVKPPPSTTPAGPGGTQEPIPDNPDEIKVID